MSFIHIKKIQKQDPETGMRELYAVPSVAIATQQGRKLIPNPGGAEASLFASLEEAEEAIRRAGFDYVFEGKKTYLMNQTGNAKAAPMASGNPLEQAVPSLIRQLQDREPSVVANSAFALGALKASSALEDLSGILGHDDPAVRKAAAEAMARFGVAALPYLRDAFQAAKTSPKANAPYIRLTVMNAFLEMMQSGLGLSLLDQITPLALDGLQDESWLVRAQSALVVGHAAQEEERLRMADKNKNVPGKRS